MIRTLPLKKLHIYVVLSLLIFIGFQSAEYLEIPMPVWVTSYLKDFLSIPIIATICLHVVWWMKKDKGIRLNTFVILSLVALYSVYFEWYLPQYSSRHTGDFGDVICYSLGGCIFYFLQKCEN